MILHFSQGHAAYVFSPFYRFLNQRSNEVEGNMETTIHDVKDQLWKSNYDVKDDFKKAIFRGINKQQERFQGHL